MKTKHEQLGLFSIIWIGFTFIAGITFTASFSNIVLNPKNNEGIGLHIIWIFAIEGFIAFMCGWAFGKLVKYHPQANGGGSQYVRTAFGKFWGLLMGFLNYSVIPVIGMVLIVTMIRTNFDSWKNSWSHLYLDLIGFSLYVLASTIIFFGIRKYKYVGLIIGYMTWTITVLLMIFGLTAGFMNLNMGTNPFKNYLHPNMTIDSFVKASTTCFFAFCGIETFVSTGKNIKNRSKNMPIAIIVIMIATTAFYIVFAIITMFAVGANPFSSNPNTQLFPENNFLKEYGKYLVIACTILMRFNSSLQITMFGGVTLEPMASQGFISNIFKKENKENVPVAGVLATIFLFIICAFIFLFIPDIIEGVTKKPSPLDYSTIASCASMILILIYSIIIPTVIYQGIRKKVKIKIWEYVSWILTFIFLMFLFIGYFAFILMSPFIKPLGGCINSSENIQGIISTIFQISYFLGVIIWAIIQYFWVYKTKMKKMDKESQRAKEIFEYEKLFRLLSFEEIENIRLEEEKIGKEEKMEKINNKNQIKKNS